MKAILSILALCLLSVDIRADEAEIPAQGVKPKRAKEAEFQFDGLWKPKGAMLGGVLLPPSALTAITLTIAKNRYEVTVLGEDHSDTGTFTIDETVTPKRMTIKSMSGPNKGKTILAIFEVKGPNAMRVCYDLTGRGFPKEFKAPKDTEFYLVGYRRQALDEPAGQPFVIGNREEPTKSQLSAFAKSFCVAMRRRHDDKNPASLRKYFDPRYLERHGLLEGAFRIRMAPVNGIHNIQLADDNRSVLCHFNTDGGRSEVVLLRTVVVDRCLYLSPIKAPDESTKVFEPWILRMAL